MALREQAEADLEARHDESRPAQGGTDEPAPVAVDPDVAEVRLAQVVAELGGVPRAAQIAMTRAVAEAVTAGEHLLVAAPTGTGKTLGYAVPASLATGGLPVLISTATKALQQQLVDSDLAALAAVDPDLEVAVLKGRGEYVCRAKLHDLAVMEPLFDSPVDPDAWEALVEWAGRTPTGDRADAPDGVTDAEWRGVSVSARECPGKNDCPFGSECFAEDAREHAREADIVIVNHHLVLHDALADRWVLPKHALLFLDEAHKLADIASSALGATIHPKRLTDLAAQVAPHVGDRHTDRLRQATLRLVDTLESLDPERAADVTAEPLAGVLDELQGATRALRSALTTAQRDVATDTGTPRADATQSTSVRGDDAAADGLTRLVKLVTSLGEDLEMVTEADTNDRVAFVEVGRSSRALRVAPIEVDDLLARLVFSERTVVATSATLTVGGRLEPTAARIGMDAHPWRQLQVPSPFDYPRNALLYVPRDAPDPRQPGYDAAAFATSLALIEAAQGRSLLLFTSWARLHATAEWLAERLPGTLEMLVQGTGPPRRLIEHYIANEHSILLGVASFWEGISAEGLSSVNVIVDKLPFARRGDPLTDARRRAAEDAGDNAFAVVDLPHAAIALAQGVGRLIRRVDDFGCIAVLDSRLATKTYRTTLLGSLPPARRTINLTVPDGCALPDEPTARLAALEAVPGGPPATEWLRTRLALAGR